MHSQSFRSISEMQRIAIRQAKLRGFGFLSYLLILPVLVTNTSGQDSSRCWDSERINQHTNGGTNAPNVTTVEGCKEVCFNNTSCRGIDWDYTTYGGCWLQFNSGNVPFASGSNITHWTLVNCSALNRCWDQGLINRQVVGGTRADTKSLEDCKHQCLYIESCSGLDWSYTDNSCWLQVDNNNQPVAANWNTTHWSLTNCPPTTTKISPKTTSTTTTGDVTIFKDISPPSVVTDASSSSSTLSSVGSSSSSGLIAAVIALAVLLGIWTLIIVVLLIIILIKKEQLCKKSVTKDETYQDLDLQKTDPSASNATHTYAELQMTKTPRETLMAV